MEKEEEELVREELRDHRGGYGANDENEQLEENRLFVNFTTNSVRQHRLHSHIESGLLNNALQHKQQHLEGGHRGTRRRGTNNFEIQQSASNEQGGHNVRS